MAKQDAKKAGYVRLSPVPLSYLRPAPENDTLYRPVTKDDPEIMSLADSIAKDGLLEPIVMSKDGYILSGHRRYVAAGVAGLSTVTCRIEDVWHDDEPDRFLTLLREYNRQREKTLEEKLREEVVSADPDEAYESLIDFRKKRSEITVQTLVLGEGRARGRITEAKRPLLDTAKRIIFVERRAFWPRRIDNALFVDEAGTIRWLDRPAALFGWLADQFGIIDWRRGVGCVAKDEAFAEMQGTSQKYAGIETLPHEPLLQSHDYTCGAIPPGDGSTLAKFLAFFTPATPIDRQLLVGLAALSTFPRVRKSRLSNRDS